jgi:hypothetical protein
MYFALFWMPNALEMLIEAIDNTYILKIMKRKVFLGKCEKNPSLDRFLPHPAKITRQKTLFAIKN